MHSAWALWNGSLMPLAAVRVSPLDRAYLFGDAVYEVMRVYGRRPFMMAAHLDRLKASLDALMIVHDVSAVGERIRRLIAQAGVPEAAVYVQVSRGEGKRAHVPPAGMRPNELLWIDPLPQDYGLRKRETGVSVALIEDQRWGYCRVKSVNLLGNVLAGMEAEARGADEALLYDRDGRITEGTHASFFAVEDGALVTTPLSANILPGVTRKLLLPLARRLDIPVKERSMARAELPGMDELFFTGTLSEVLPIVAVDGVPVRNGVPGPVTRRLLAAMIDRLKAGDDGSE